MNVVISTSPSFERAFKRLAKHYSSFVEDIIALKKEIMSNPQLGTDLGNGFRKIRMRIKSKGKGKSGGARVISFTIYATTTETSINLLYLYDKAERSSVSITELEKLLIVNGLR